MTIYPPPGMRTFSLAFMALWMSFYLGFRGEWDATGWALVIGAVTGVYAAKTTFKNRNGGAE